MPRRPRAAALALALAALCLPAAAESTRTLRLELSGDPGREFAVENLAGRLTVTRGSGPTVVAVATVHAADEALAARVRFEQLRGRNGVPTLRVRYPVEDHDRFRYPAAPGSEGFAAWLGFGRSRTSYDGRRVEVSDDRGVLLYADVAVEVPAGAGEGIFVNHVGPIEARDVEARRLIFDGSTGPIALRRLAGDVRADTGSGHVRAEELRGRFRCDTGSGDCELRGFDGEEVECDTGSGEIEIDSARAGRVKVDTGSGDIRLVGVDAERIGADTGSGDVRLEAAGARLSSIRVDTGSGDVTLGIGADTGFLLRADTGSGRIESDFRDAEPIRRGKEVVGYRRGDERLDIRADTGSGDIRVRP